MEKIVLKALVREEKGTGSCKAMRREGLIPSVVYKSGKQGINVTVDKNEVWQAMHTEAGENAIITMDIKSGEKDIKKTVIVKEVQKDPVTDLFVHIDFHEISLKDKLKVKVPIAVKGEAIGVKEEEGILAQIEWELEVECLPTAIPEHLDINVEELRIGDAIHIKDIVLDEGVTIIGDPEHVVVTVTPPMAEEPEEEEEGLETEEGAEEPDVIKKGKKEEEEGAEAAPAEEA